MTDQLQAAIIVSSFVVVLVATFVFSERCRQCGSFWWQQEVVSNPELSPMAPFVRHCKRCGLVTPEML